MTQICSIPTMMIRLTPLLLVVLLNALLGTTTSFAPTRRLAHRKIVRATFMSTDDVSNNQGADDKHNEEENNTSMNKKPAPFEPQLISSVTAVNPNIEETDNDTGGVIPRDGSLLLLIPSLVITVVGVVAAIGIALNSGDAISQAAGEMKQGYVESFKPKPAVYEASENCRGLCSNQEEDLDGLRTFMQKISRTSSTQE